MIKKKFVVLESYYLHTFFFIFHEALMHIHLHIRKFISFPQVVFNKNAGTFIQQYFNFLPGATFFSYLLTKSAQNKHILVELPNPIRPRVLKMSVRFWNLKILWIWNFAMTWLTKMAVTRSIFEKEGSYFGFVLIFLCLKNHI